MNKFNIELTSNRLSTFLSTVHLTKHQNQATLQEIHVYQQRIGFINFAAVITRSDVAHAASKFSEFLTNPSKSHMEFADRTIAYLGHTKHLSIRFNPHADISDPINYTFLGSSDALFADDLLIRYSSQEYAFKLFDGLID